jgi:replicative DNA helicase
MPDVNPATRTPALGHLTAVTGHIHPAPHHSDAEAAVLVALMVGEVRPEDVAPLAPVHFYHTAHRYVFEAIVRLHEEGVAVDTVTVCSKLRDMGRLVDVGGTDALAQLQDVTPALDALSGYVRAILDTWALREGERIGQRFVAACRRHGEDVGDLLHKMAERITKLNADRSQAEAPTDLLTGYRADMARAEAEALAPVAHVPTGFSTVNEAMDGGWWSSKLAVLGARPGTGKTAVAIRSALACASTPPEHGGGGALLVSVELPGAEMRQRVLSHESGLTAAQVRQPMGEEVVATMNTALAHLCRLPLWIDDTARTAPAVRASVRRHVRLAQQAGVPLRFVALDYVQLLKSGREHKSRQDELTDVCQQLTEMRREHPGVSFLVLAQLNRESSDGRKPRDSDLRECGQLEQDADTIAMLWFPEKEDPNVVEMVFAKNRGHRRDLTPRFRVYPQIGRLEEVQP